MSSSIRAHYRAPSLPHLALPGISTQLSLLHHHSNIQLNPEKIAGKKLKNGAAAKITQTLSRISHKHSQSLDSSSVYIPISECHSGSARSVQQPMAPPPPPPSAASLATSRLSVASYQTTTSLPSSAHHVRSSSQLSMSPTKACSVQQLDVPTNRHFKVYQKCPSNSSLSTTATAITPTSLNGPSAPSACSSLNGELLVDAFSQLNVNAHERHLSTGSSTSSMTHLYGNCGSMVMQPPPRPPKPAALRSVSCTPAPCEEESPLPSAPSLLGLRTLTREPSTHSNSSALTSSTISSYGCMSGFSQFASLNGYGYGAPGHQRPKNSVSSSCSSNPSPLGAPISMRGKDSCVFTYDQLGASFAEDEQSDKSQPSSPFAAFSTTLTPPAVDRALKPRKSTLDSSRCTYNNCSCSQCCNRYSPASAFQLQAPRPSTCRGRNYSTESASEDDALALYESNFRSSGSYQRWDQQAPTHLAPLPPQEDEIQYLDLDLDNNGSASTNASTTDNQSNKETRTSGSQFGSVSSLSTAARESQTVYKTVDFVKTEAFNKLRELRGQQHAL